MTIPTKKMFAEGITLHTGMEVSEEQVLIARDPQVRNTYAVRVKGFFVDGDLDCLFVFGLENPSVEKIDEFLEEVEYDSWPPRSGNLQFFM